ncbi:D-mannonate dehydratase ManD [Rhodococcus marinonascens]|uniref:D-mannonate dehydratase ManD n=1 Tax=Rhodococcus marinonascens TaxID=38311 RepID=UPI00093308BA|nr:D-mannonate dehydratase ManD [Rhodococcus marinonascens]
MKIEDVQVIVSSPTRNFVTLKIRTSDGVIGLGDATLNGRELAVASYLRDHIGPLLIARDPSQIEDTWNYLYKGAYWRRGPVTMAAIAAVDMALWDIKGKVAGLPVYQLLGGASREGCLAYTHATGADMPELIDSVHRQLELGYRAIRAQSGVPGLDGVYGIGRSDDVDYEPAGRGARPSEETWDTSAYLRHIPSVFEQLRNQFGHELPLLHDAHHRLTPQQAARLGKDLEPYDLFWLEDVTPAENPSALRLVRQHTTIPLAIGEVFNSIWDAELLLREQLIDFIRCAIVHAGGITHVRKIWSMAELYQVRTGSHGPSDVSPIGLAAALHMGLSAPNFGIQEHMRHQPLVDEVFRHAYRFDDGYLHPGDEPGLGISLDEELATRYPYECAYLPVAHLPDGTVHDW